MQKIKKDIFRLPYLSTLFTSSLYRNSIYLMLSSILGAGSGFIFWIVAARFYSSGDIGIASGIVSSLRILGMLSVVGLDLTLVRFLSEKKEKSNLIISAILFSSVISILLSIVFLIFINFISPSLSILRIPKYASLFVLFTISLSITFIQGQGVFVAFREAKYTLIQNLAMLIRMMLLPFLVTLGALGIFLSFGLGIFFAAIIGFILMVKYLHLSFNKVPEVNGLFELIPFSLGVYLVRIFENLPSQILPILVLNVLGPVENAYFFIAWWTMFFITMIPRMTSLSLVAEGSYDTKTFNQKLLGSIKFVVLLTSIAVLIFFFFGQFILLIFGKEYAIHSLHILRILLLGNIPYSINVLYVANMIVKKDVKKAILIYGTISLSTILLGYIFLGFFGSLGIGYAWILGNVMVMLAIFAYVFKTLKFLIVIRK
ncbi:lipopolysaccharide biosynthesis protein [Thermococcus sp. SY098]|uniref:lipopolysaccharide biosynthesis protein n=1 Tax=Thermococcus sp. SY098 TaxID=3111325 RepID=UPI002D77E64B|nr:lipopolysaccharide biosynthesis protein [Thermococcus sp. SY098]WRS52136.1 lipopolysaccharide biosynthesis protein [Thermococcus sp. SY098]